MIVMKDEVKGNFIIFQNVFYPEKSRQVFCKKYSLSLFFFVVVVVPYSDENKYFSPKAKFWEKILKSDLIPGGCSMEFFRNELMITTEGL